MEKWETLQRSGSGYEGEEGVHLLERAVALRPDSAMAWGRLAFVQAALADYAPPAGAAQTVDRAAAAARRALAIDPQEPNALTGLALLQGSMTGWAVFDARLRRALTIDPRNPLALVILVALTQAAGMNRESWTLNERALALEPLSSIHIFRTAFKLWIRGDVAGSSKVIDRAADLWPTDPGVWNARLIILAFTDRPLAARSMIDDRPRMLGLPIATSMWRAALTALERRSPPTIAEARTLCLDAARTAPALAAHAVMILSALGEIDPAFEIANGFLLSRGPIAMRAASGSTHEWIHDAGWKWTQWLFTPPVAAMRADARFLPLCEAFGLGDYWRKRGVRPDYLSQRR